jgi:hypothetical protein
MDNLPRNEASGKERERGRERETFLRVALAREFFSHLLSLTCSESEREARSFDLNIKSLTIYLLSNFFTVELTNG